MMRMVGRKILAAAGMAKANAPSAPRSGSGFLLEAIEPRVLLSADVLSAVLDSPLHPQQTQEPAPLLLQLSDAALEPLVSEALSRLEATGFNADEMERAHHVQVSVSDLPEWELAETDGQSIRVDSNAAGFDWYIDKQPADDTEYRT